MGTNSHCVPICSTGPALIVQLWAQICKFLRLPIHLALTIANCEGRTLKEEKKNHRNKVQHLFLYLLDKGGLISKGIFNLVSTSNFPTNSLSLNFLPERGPIFFFTFDFRLVYKRWLIFFSQISNQNLTGPIKKMQKLPQIDFNLTQTTGITIFLIKNL